MQFIRRWLARRRVSLAPFPCPHCGSEVPGGRKSCPECGASESDGWGEGSEEHRESWEGAEPGGWEDDSEFDYDSFVEREFGERESGEWGRGPGNAALKPDPKRLVLWIVIFAFAATLLLPLFF